jgi:hypothetical protein
MFVAVLFVAVLQHRPDEAATRCVESGSTFHGRWQDLSRGQDQARRHRAPPAATISMMTPESTRAGNVAAAAAARHRPIPCHPRRRRRKYEQPWDGGGHPPSTRQEAASPTRPIYGQWRLWTRTAQSATRAAKLRARVIALWRQISGLRRIPDHPGPQGPHGTIAEGTMRAGSRP